MIRRAPFLEGDPAETGAVRDIFLEAIELSDQGRRDFLEVACAGNRALRARVEDLLEEMETVGDFIENPAATPTALGGASEGPGQVIGRYTLLEKIGEGGAGVVYMAEQTAPVRRRVALKVIKLGMDTRSVIARFEAERQALAMMDHPNIAKVFDGGATEAGRPYFVMELVRGVRITDYCNQHQLAPADRLRLFVEVCQAIQHAHQKGIIHRDIKPSNILVMAGDLGPAPKVIDFGIAKATEQPLTEKTLFTEFRSFIGTPAYMSPEQIEMAGGDVDTRSDIYSLGVLLYELLTGGTPFPASLMTAGVDEFRRTIRNDDPQLPSTRINALSAPTLATTASERRVEARTFFRLLQGELDWIVMKCLEKDRARRYATANDLAADVGRFLAGEPILARPPSSAYRLRKFLHRHQISVAAGVVVLLSLVAAAVVSIREAGRSRAAEQVANAERIKAVAESRRAQRNEARALLNEYVADITLGHQALSAGNLGRAAFLLGKHAPQKGRADLRGFEWGYLAHAVQGSPHQTLVAAGDSIRAVTFSPDGKFIAVAARKKTTVYNAGDQSVKAVSVGAALSLAFAQDSSQLFIADQNSIRAIDLRDGAERIMTREAGAPVAMAPDGQQLAAGTRDNVRLFQIAPWAGVRTFFRSSGPLAFSPDGKNLLTAGRRGFWNWPLAVDKEEPEEILAHGFFNFFRNTSGLIVFAPDGTKFFAPQDRLLIGYDAATGSEVGRFPLDGKALHTSAITSVALSPDGKTIATGSWDHSIQVWDAPTFKHTATLQGHLNEVWSLAFAPDGKFLVSGAKDGGVFLWPMEHPQEIDFVAGDWQPIRFAVDDRSLVAVNRRGALAEIDVRSGAVREIWSEPLSRRDGFGRQLSVSANLQVVARITSDRTVIVHDRRTGNEVGVPEVEGSIAMVTLAPNGRSLVISTWDRALYYYDLERRSNYALPTGFDRAVFTPDSSRLALVARAAVGAVWNCATHLTERTLKFEIPVGFDYAISPDNRTIAATALPDLSNTIELMDLQTGKSIGILDGHKQGVGQVGFSADGRTLASTSVDGLKLWNVATLQETLTFPIEGVRGPVFSNAGNFLAFTVRSESGEGIRLLRATYSPAAAPAPRE